MVALHIRQGCGQSFEFHSEKSISMTSCSCPESYTCEHSPPFKDRHWQQDVYLDEDTKSTERMMADVDRGWRRCTCYPQVALDSPGGLCHREWKERKPHLLIRALSLQVRFNKGTMHIFLSRRSLTSTEVYIRPPQLESSSMKGIHSPFSYLLAVEKSNYKFKLAMFVPQVR